MSSTVPRLTAVLREMATRYLDLPAVVLEPGTRSGMPILYDNPRQVGPDRIANAVGAFDLYGGPTLVVDFGTATTIDATSAAGRVPRRAPSSPASRSASTPSSTGPRPCRGSSWSRPGG